MSKQKNETPIIAEEMLSKSEAFVQKYKKAIVGIITVIILAIAGLLAYNNFVLEPKENEAAANIVYAQDYFEKDSFELALNGDGVNPGFLTIINEYDGTPTANLALAQAGICYAQLGQFDEAIKTLEQYEGEDKIVAPKVKHALGNCYSHKENYDKAIELVLEAADEAKNIAVTPYCLFDAAAMYEAKGNAAEAVKLYERITKEYPNSPVATQAKNLLEAAK
jgi:tetratricopeptide (TPR) repeat protein